MGTQGLELRFTGEPRFIDELERALQGEGEAQVEIVDRGEVHDATDLRLDLGTVSDIVTIVSAAYFSGPIVPTLLGVLRRAPATHQGVEPIRRGDVRAL